MEMHQVRYFLAVARILNFTQAADECHVAQPSLSRAIKKLEEELGGDLFRRERSLTHLTELGRMMLPLLTQTYDTALAAKSLATSFKKGECAPLRLALSHTIMLEVLVAPLTELVRVFPGLELVFFRGTGAEVTEQLKNGDSEVALTGPLRDGWERFDRWPLFTERYNLVVNSAHPLAGQQSVPLASLADTRLLCRPYCEQCDEFLAMLSAHGIAPVSNDQVACDHDLLALLQANVGVGMMPTSTRRLDNLARLDVEGLDLARTVTLWAVAGRRHSPAAGALIKLLRAADWSAMETAKAAPVSLPPAPLAPGSPGSHAQAAQ